MKENLPNKLLLICVLLLSWQSWAQTRSISGSVTDQNGMPLPGVTVQIKESNSGTITDFDGHFTLTVPNDSGAVLLFSFLGFQQQEIPLENNAVFNIQLEQDMQALDEVVVTALGIERQEKRLGYAQSTVGSESLTQAPPTNWSSGLKGKVAGLNIVSSGSGPVNSQQITLRGNNSLNPNGNNALIVVDGVPMNNEMTTSGSSSAYTGADSPIDYGNAISDLNAEDIESVTVLKGPGATALYGSRAANGALIITTKSGKRGQGLGITYTNNTSFDVIQRWPDYQYEYGQGTGKSFDDNGEPYYSYGASQDGPNTGSTSSAWGPRFEGQYFYQYDPELEGQGLERTLWQPYKNNRKDFFRTGVTIKNSVSLQGGGENGSMRASIGHEKNQWIMPNTGYERITASVNATYQISDRIQLGSVINYNNRTSDNLPSTGYNNGSLAYFMIFQNPNIPLDWYRPIWKQGQENIDKIAPFSSYIDNPYLIAHEATNPLKSDQIIGNIHATIDLAPGLDLMLRSSINTYSQVREQKRPYSINRYARGYYQSQNIHKMETNNDFLLTYKNEEPDQDFGYSVSFGGNAMSYEYSRINASVEQLVVPGVYKLANGVNNPLITTSDRNKKVNSLYGLASFSFRDMIFLDFTGRNDWSSTLPESNNSFFYPSANLSLIVSDMVSMPAAIDYLKYRFSFAQVGNDTDPYRTSKYYSQNAFPSSATVPLTLYNATFKPEITTSFETGIETRLLNNRLNFDLTLYQTETSNQILSVPLDITTGYNAGILNSGVVQNKGVELGLGGRIVDTPGFSWRSNLTWSRNWNKVLELADGLNNQQEIGSGGQATLLAKVGGTSTAIYGFGFVRSPDGQIVYDNGGLAAYPDEVQYIGDASPDWRAGFHNSLHFGPVRLNVLLDGQYGGIVYSQSYHKLMEQGKLKDTYPGREQGYIIGEGVVQNADGSYSPNTIETVPADWYGRQYRRANVESNSFDASFIKLREVSLGFSFPQQWLNNTGVQGLDFSVYGRNLAMISDFPIYDPETAALNGDTILPGIEMGQMPSPATYGFTLRANF